LPYAVHSLGMLPPAEFWRRGAQLVAPTWRRWEVPPGELGGMFRFLCLDTCPPSLRLPSDFGAPNSRPLRPEAGDWVLGGELPAWTAHLPAQPTVYATLGTVDNEAPGVMETVLAALGGEEINVIATTGPSRDPAELGPQPSNVHVERYVTQSLLFPRCDAVVTHGGSGTLLTALGHGLPLLVLPQGANQFDNAERCVTAGAGIRLLPEELTPEAVLAGVRRLLDDQTYRRASARVADEIRAMPGPDLAVRELESMSEAGAAGIEAVGVRESGAE
jgi:hypothetical protein